MLPFSIPEKCSREHFFFTPHFISLLSFENHQKETRAFTVIIHNQTHLLRSSALSFLAFVGIPRLFLIKYLQGITRITSTINKMQRCCSIMQDSTSTSTKMGPRSVVMTYTFRRPQHCPDLVPSSPRHCGNEINDVATQRPFLSDVPSQPSVFVSFDNNGCDESNKEIELQASRSTLSRSSSFDSVDMEMEMLDVSMEPCAISLRRTVPSLPRTHYSSKSSSSYRPSDPVARFLLTK